MRPFRSSAIPSAVSFVAPVVVFVVAAVVASVALLLPSAPVLAQVAAGDTVRVPVRGTVLEEGGAPLADVRVRAGGRTAVTGADGRFSLRLRPGAWTLAFSRLGYRTAEERVRVSSAQAREAPAPLRVRLDPDPVALRDLRVRAGRGLALAVPLPRQDMLEAPALAEPDVFRAARRLPGASQPNDLQGRLHLAGGASDETGVRLDGHPIHDPFHLLGLLGAIHPSALEGAELRMHHLPAARGGRLSGLLELETRRTPDGEEELQASASLLSTSATFSRAGGGPEVLAFGRVAYADRVAPIIAPDLPRLSYQDALLRVGEDLGDGWRAEALGFLTRNRLTAGEVRDFEPTRPLDWGERLVGVRLERLGGGWGVRLRASTSEATTDFEGRNTWGEEESDGAGELIRIRLERHRASGETALVGRGERWRVEAGAAYEDRWYEQAWSGLGRAREVLSPGIPAEHRAVQGLDLLALFGEAEARPGPFRLSAALRALGTRERWRLAPRFLAGWRPSDRLRVEAALGRRYQFTSVLREPIEYSVPPPEFLLRTPRRADVAAVGAEWTGPAWPGTGPRPRPVRLRVDAFWKAYGARPLIPDRPELGREDRRAVGVLASATVPLGPEASLEAAYAWQCATVRQIEDAHPAGWDVPHDLSLEVRVPGPWGLRLSAAGRLHSGTPFTPLRRVAPTDDFIFGRYRSDRLRPYLRLDLGARRDWRWGDSRWSAFLHVLNVTRRENPLEPDYRALRGLPSEGPARVGLPLVPSLGVEVRL